MKRARPIDFPIRSVLACPRPLWRSLEAAIAWQIDIGRLPAGSRIPSTRTVARHLRLSRNTVALAFDALTANGYLAARVGDGTYVLAHAERVRPPLWQRRRRWIRDADGLLVWVTT